MKICKTCKIEREIEDFSLLTPSLKTGAERRRSSCKFCKNLKAKKYYEENKEKILDSRKYHNKDISNRREWYKNWEKNRINSDIKFRFIKNLRIRHNSILKGKISTTKNLGCNSEDFKNYLQSLFLEGMTWNNYGFGKGKWCIDHIIPLSLVILDENNNVIENEFNLKLIHYTNMQPMWFEENMAKSNKY